MLKTNNKRSDETGLCPVPKRHQVWEGKSGRPSKGYDQKKVSKNQTIIFLGSLGQTQGSTFVKYVDQSGSAQTNIKAKKLFFNSTSTAFSWSLDVGSCAEPSIAQLPPPSLWVCL